ncbi:Hpt domain-containing protein [Inhella gelatinilytica]|uniref:Hpt domain-containing protein n=1 Tax=Inhella gelatinilytica TaxID=2795030 RepID=A0A931NFH3_9BURK|nr:Hpt domain-containing protein [Inhella gelatinilytica]MBH9553551.1 Hpt domain-containing protein [Inhella gelatinilytica]
MAAPAPVELDAAALAALRALDPDGSQQLLARLTAAFERNLARLLPELDAAMAAGPDWVRIGRAAHTLKSSCSNLAALGLSSAWQSIEHKCKEGQVDSLADELALARAGLADLLETLRALK